MEVGHRQQLGAALFQPALLLQALALGAVAVAAGVVDDLACLAVGTLVDMTAQSGGPAGLDGSQGPQVGTAELAVIRLTESGPEPTDDVSHLQSIGGGHAAARLFS